MCRFTSLLALLALQISVVYCQSQNPWWSIIGTDGVLNPNDPLQPNNLKCSHFHSILSTQQMSLCQTYGDKILSCSAIGTFKALTQCQELFKDRPWNCSVFDSTTHYLGRFVTTGTRETAFLNAIISAGIAREIARKCKEQELTSCSCDFSVQGSTTAKSRNISGCGDNCDFGIRFTKQFTDTVLIGKNDPIALAELHNNNVGRMLVKNTKVACVCHGVSGSCSVRTCFKKVPDIEELGQQLLKLYDLAKHVKKNGTVLIPVGSTIPALKSDELVYLQFSPNFCQRNLTYGVYGTSGRQCYPNRNDQSSCGSLCCGRPTEQKMIEYTEDQKSCCEFVWCCHLDCNKCRTFKATEYYCQ